MKVKRMGITEILRRIWLFSENKVKSSESFSKQPTQLIIQLNSSLRHIIVTQKLKFVGHVHFQMDQTKSGLIFFPKDGYRLDIFLTR